MGKYRVRPERVEALQLRDDNLYEFVQWVRGCGGTVCVASEDGDDPVLEVITDEGTTIIQRDDWLIKRPAQRFELCDYELFGQRYEEV